MQLLQLALLAATASTAAAQAVTAILKPTAPNPTGCRTSMPTTFNIYKSEIHGSSKKRAVEVTNAADAGSALQVNLTNTVLTDSSGRTGAIVANYQFQFDGPPQAGTLYTAGFCLLPNNSLVLGSSAVWWSCNSGGFDNLYDRWWAAQCRPVLLNAFNTGSDPSTISASGAAASATSSVSVLVSSVTRSASGSQTASASSASGSHSTSFTTTGTATKASTVPAPSATSSKGAAPTGVRIGGMAIAAGILGMAVL